MDAQAINELNIPKSKRDDYRRRKSTVSPEKQELQFPLDKNEVISKLWQVYHDSKFSLPENGLIHSSASRLPGRNEFFISPPVGFRHDIRVQKSMNKLISTINDRADDGTYAKRDKAIRETIEQLAQEYMDYMNSLVEEEVDVIISEDIENDVKEKERELEEEGLQEFESCFEKNPETLLTGTDKAKMEKIKKEKSGSELQQAIQELKSELYDKYRQRYRQELNSKIQKAIADYKANKETQLRKQRDSSFHELAGRVFSQLSEPTFNNFIKRFQKLVRS